MVRELTDESFDFHEIKSTGHGKFEIEVLTEGNEDFPLPIQKASQGTLSVLAIFSLIYNLLRSVHDKVPERDILDQTGIVIIDEIDAHLHPSWQQKILGLLRRKFKNVQFLVTAHSPLVVAGCLAGEVTVLRKRDGRFALEQVQYDFVGAESASLYGELFEIKELDESFLYFLTQGSLGEDYEKEINELEEKKNLSPKDERELARLHRLGHYTIRAAEVKKERESRDFERIIAELRARNRELERRLGSERKDKQGESKKEE